MKAVYKATFLTVLVSMSMLAGCFGSDGSVGETVEEDSFFTFKDQLGNNTWYHYPGGLNAVSYTLLTLPTTPHV